MKNTAIYRALILLFFLALTGIPAAALQTFTPQPPPIPGVCDLAFSPDRQMIMAASDDGHLALWATNTGVLLHKFYNRGNCPRIVFLGDGETVFTIQYGIITGEEAEAVLWDIQTGEEMRRFTGRAVLSDDQSLLLTASPDTFPQLWDMATGQVIRSFDHTMRFTGTGRISPDHTRLLSHTWPLRYPELWDLTTGELLFTFPEGDAWVSWLQFSPDGRFALVKHMRFPTQLWDLNTLTLRHTFPGSLDVYPLKLMSEDDQMRWLGFRYPGVFLTWDVLSGELLQETPLTPPIPYDDMTGSRLSNDGRSFLIELRQGIVQLWDVETGTLKHQFNPQADSAVDWNQTRTQTAFSADNRYVLVGYSNEAVHLWDTETGMEIRTYHLPE